MVARGLIASEIAEKYDRALNTVQKHWMRAPVWPDAIGKRGRWAEFDADQVDAVVRAHFLRSDPDAGGDPGELLDAAQIAAYTALAPGTIRADIARGRLGEPDDTSDGVRRWTRASVDAVMHRRRRYGRRSGSTAADR